MNTASRRSIIIALAAAWMASGCGARQTAVTREWPYDSAQQLLLADHARLAFPMVLGGFRRQQFSAAEDGTSEASAEYLFGPVSVNVFVESAAGRDIREALEADYREHLQVILSEYRTVDQLSEDVLELHGVRGRGMVFQWEDRGIPIGGALYLFRFHDHLVTFRMRARGHDVRDAVQSLDRMVEDFWSLNA